MLDENKYEYLDIANLELDKQNPRLPKTVRDKDDYEILKEMWISFSLEELVISIVQNGFIPAEPLMVVKNNDNYVVVEGNRRLSAVKLLTDDAYKNDSFFKDKLSEYKLKTNINKLPCYIFSKREDIDSALAVRHIKGIKTWGAREKAEYVNKLYENKKNITQVNNIIGSKTDAVGSLIYAYRWLEYLTKENPNNRELRDFFNDRFSLLYLALGQKRIREIFLRIEEKWSNLDYDVRKNKKDSPLYKNMLLLCGWLSNESLIQDSRQITGGKNNPVSLSAILDDKDATEYLVNTTNANNLGTNTLHDAYFRVASDSALESRFEKMANELRTLSIIVKQKRESLDERSKNNIKVFFDDMKTTIEKCEL